MPAISLQSGFADPMNRARVAAALFAAGALGQPKPLFAGRPARPIDIWREQVFITNPCQVTPQQKPATADAVSADRESVTPAGSAPEEAASAPARRRSRHLCMRDRVRAAAARPAADRQRLTARPAAPAEATSAEPSQAESRPSPAGRVRPGRTKEAEPSQA